MSPTPLIAQCRRAYFAILTALGLKDEADRHAFNVDNVGIESTRDPAWTLSHWLMAVSCLQIAAGRKGVVPGHPHLKGLLPDGRHAEDDPWPLDGAATRSQIAYIQDLAAKRMRNPDRLPELIRRHAFTPRQASLAMQWRGTLATLPRPVAAIAILILLRLREPSPSPLGRGEGEGASAQAPSGQEEPARA